MESVGLWVLLQEVSVRVAQSCPWCGSVMYLRGIVQNPENLSVLFILRGWNETWRNLFKWKVSMAGGWNKMGFKVPSNPIPSMSLWSWVANFSTAMLLRWIFPPGLYYPNGGEIPGRRNSFFPHCLQAAKAAVFACDLKIECMLWSKQHPCSILPFLKATKA